MPRNGALPLQDPVGLPSVALLVVLGALAAVAAREIWRHYLR